MGDGPWTVTYSANSAAKVSEVVRETSEWVEDETCDSNCG